MRMCVQAFKGKDTDTKENLLEADNHHEARTLQVITKRTSEYNLLYPTEFLLVDSKLSWGVQWMTEFLLRISEKQKKKCTKARKA